MNMDPKEMKKEALRAVRDEDWEEAYQRLTEVLKETPQHSFLSRLLAQVLRELDRVDEAEKTLLSAVQRCEESDTVSRRELLLELADLHLQEAAPQKAAWVLKQVLKKEPHQWEALYLLGNAFMDVGALDEAIKAYRQSLMSHPFDKDIWWNFAVSLEKKGELKEAAMAYDAWLSQAKDHPESEKEEIRAFVQAFKEA